MNKGEARTQLEQDWIENGDFGERGYVSPLIYSQRGPSSKCCGAPYIKKSEDVFWCIDCRRHYTGGYLRSIGIDPKFIG